MRRLLPVLLRVLLLVLAATPGAAACPEPAVVARLARQFLDREPVQGYGPGLSLADGACARERLVALLAQPFGDAVGYKVGLTSAAVQQRFGVAHPIRGTIFHGTLRESSGAELPARFGAVPVVESDLLVRVAGEEVLGAGDDPVAILRQLDQVIPFLELADLAFAPGAPIDAANLVAINAGARLGVLGTPIPVQATEDFARRLAGMTVVLSTDQRELARAPGRALLGHPLNAVAWLAQDLAAEGRRLRAGAYISLGSFSPPVPPEAGRTFTARYEGLLPDPVAVSVRFR